MAAPSVTYTFTNGTTSDATQVNTNFTDLIDCMSDGTTDFSIGSLTVAGATTFNGTVTLGNSTADSVTFTGNLASSITLSATATYNIGSATVGLLSVYLGNGSFTTRILAGSLTASYTITLPVASPGQTGKTMIFTDVGLAEFRYIDKILEAKTSNYTATGDETVIQADASGGSFTIALPAAASFTGKRYIVKRIDNTLANTVTIDPNSSEEVDFISDGSGWIVIGSKTHWVSTAGAWVVTSTGGSPAVGTATFNTVITTRYGNRARVVYQLRTTAAGTNPTAGDLFVGFPTNVLPDSTVQFTTTGSNAAPASAQGPDIGVFSGNNITSANGQAQLLAIPYDNTKFRLVGLIGGAGAVWYTSSAFSLATTSFQLGGYIDYPVANWNA
jgi:hypothetical protein